MHDHKFENLSYKTSRTDQKFCQELRKLPNSNNKKKFFNGNLIKKK